MTAVAESARVSIILADFANVSGDGKLNVIGGGVSITAIDPQTGQSAPLTVLLQVNVSPEFLGTDYSLELGLYGPDGQPFTPPGPTDMQPIRIARPVRAEPSPAPQGTYLPRDAVWPGTNMIVNFSNGLPLASGQTYEWRASIDTTVVCTANLHVAGPPPVVIG